MFSKLLKDQRPLLSAMLSPRQIAVMGASEKSGSIGRALMENLESFSGRVFPVNPNHSTILGRQTSPTISDVAKDVDLAVIATPAGTVPGIFAEQKIDSTL